MAVTDAKRVRKVTFFQKENSVNSIFPIFKSFLNLPSLKTVLVHDGVMFLEKNQKNQF